MLTTASRLRRAVAAAALVLSVAPAAAKAADPPLETLTFVLVRTAADVPTSFDINVTVRADKRGSFVGALNADVRRGRITRTQAQLFGSTRRWEESTVNAGSTRWSACSVGLCHPDFDGLHGYISRYSDDGVADAITHVFVAAVGSRILWEVKAKGWRVVRMPLAFRYLDGGETSPAFAKVGYLGAELYRDGTLAGGRYGSIAGGFPPCAITTTGAVFRGVGTVTLDGGVRSESFTCPTSRILPSSWATGPTEWRLHGTVVGDTTSRDSRLFVVDLPRRLP